MSNHKRLINVLIGAALLSAGTVASAANVVGGTVHFTGQMVNAACAVSAASANQTVQMGQYRTARFAAVGDRSGAVPFTIKLEDCDTTVATTAAVAFSGAADANDPTLLQTSNISGGAAGAADGVGIEISDNKGKVLPPDGSTFSNAQTLNDGTNILNLSARYKSTKASVTPGQADADATFTMQYN
ncbi:type 1 fimbrial major subunit FimA [Klebsiella michiganensis]|uniref:type 1 fimbrial major subunit FimA n=1 Tax=Klebsiella michiganensis TaxID=1134687 RepID=UPI00257020D9|nr:type 1 fimbrial major subunit FimA [Klebsiella michiganensis]MDL4454786.1 type 1 fimbrial major subunit FimA [Klebsiella michiganensis]MDL4455016.1 type 1 fimbrial major subunit FimA [Klebsiella michiganensis]